MKTNQTFTGVILAELRSKLSKAGKEYLEFPFRVEDRDKTLMKVLVFDKVPEFMVDVKAHTKVQLGGMYDSREKSLVCKFYYVPNAEKERKIKVFGSEESEAKRFKALVEAKEEKGFVYVQGDGFLHREDCIQVGLKWMRITDFICDKLGSSRLCAELRVGLGITTKLPSKIDRKKYVAIRDRLLAESCQTEEF